MMRRPPSPATGLSALLCLATTLACCAPSFAPARGGDGSEEPATLEPVDPQREALIRRHNELAPRVKLLWQQRQDRETFQGLEELLALYQQIYPPEDFPDGHPHTVRCYRDLCRVTEELGEFEAQWKYCQEGLAMCRRLFTREKFPHGHQDLAMMLANMGNVLVRKCQYAKAREYFQEAILEHRLLEEQSHEPSQFVNLIRLNHCMADCLDKEGMLIQVCAHTSQALELSRHLAGQDDFSFSSLHRANCLLLHARALQNVSRFKEAQMLFRQAVDEYFSVFLATQSESAHLGLIDSMIEIGALQLRNGDYQVASQVLVRANQELNELPRETQIPVSLRIKVLAQLLHLADAKALAADVTCYRSELERRLCQSQTINSGHVETARLIDCNLGLGSSFLQSGNIALAEQYFESAQALACTSDTSVNAVGDPTRVVSVECYSGYFYESIGQYYQAYTHFARALAIARETFPRSKYPNGHSILSMATEYMAAHLWLLGETDASLSLFRELCDMNDAMYPEDDFPKGHRLRLIGHGALGQILHREMAFDEAALHLNKALEIAKALYPASEFPDGHDDLSEVRRDIGRLQLSLGRPESARQLFETILETDQRRYATSFPNGHLKIALTFGDLGRALCATGDYKNAEEYHLRSLAMRRRLFPIEEYPNGHPSLANALRDLGSVYQLSARDDEAVQLFAESTHIEHSIADSFSNDSSQALLLNLTARRFRSLNNLLDSWHRTSRSAAEIYMYVWLRHGFVPRTIGERNRALQTARAAEDNEPVADHHDSYRQIAMALLVSDLEANVTLSRRVDGMRVCDTQKGLLDHHLVRKVGGVEAEGCQEQCLPQHLGQSLSTDAAFVGYVNYSHQRSDPSIAITEETASSRMLGFVITHDHPIACVDLGDAERIEELVERWRQAIMEDRQDDAGHLLRELVWDPVADFFPTETRRVYIAPDGALSLVAWGALPYGEDQRLLIESYAIATVPHGPFLVQQLRREAPQDAESGSVLVVGDVDYGAPALAKTNRSHGLKQVRWLPLQGSAREIASVAAAAADRSCVLLTRANATPTGVLEHLPHARWAHLATHGFFVDDQLETALQLTTGDAAGPRLSVNPSRCTVLGRNPFVRSGLALSGANELGELDELGVPASAKGILTAEEITSLDCSKLDLVVLSACETGRGDVVHGDGVFSIQTAFHVAGARNVVGTLWKVDDEATAQLMQEFYRLLWDEGMSPLEALRNSQLHMMRRELSSSREDRGPVLSHTVPLPKGSLRASSGVCSTIRKWAGFVLSGPGS